MTFVVTEDCIKCKYTDCVDVCPVDCFHEGPEFLAIDPDECIDCALCVPECPVDAIFDEVDVPKDQLAFIKINADLAPQWPVIDTMKPGLSDAKEWEGVAGKVQYLSAFIDEDLSPNNLDVNQNELGADLIEEAWRAYQQKLLSFIRSKVSNADDADEILSDVFLKLSKAVDDENPPENVSAWLFRVTKNRIIDYYRSNKREEQLPAEIVNEEEKLSVIQTLSNCMVPMIKALPENYRQPLMLSEIEGMKYKEVATELELTVPAVKSRILRGREMLHKSMIACCSIQRNESGDTVDFEKNNSDSCNSC